MQTKKSSSRSATTEAAARTPLAARDSVVSPTGSKPSAAGSSSRVLPGAERSCERHSRSAEQQTLAGHHLPELLVTRYSATGVDSHTEAASEPHFRSPVGLRASLVPRNPQKEPEMNAPSHTLLSVLQTAVAKHQGRKSAATQLSTAPGRRHEHRPSGPKSPASKGGAVLLF